MNRTEIFDNIINDIQKAKSNNIDLNELGNIIGQVVGKYVSDEFGFEEDDFITAIEHGISVSTNKHK